MVSVATERWLGRAGQPILFYIKFEKNKFIIFNFRSSRPENKKIQYDTFKNLKSHLKVVTLIIITIVMKKLVEK